MKKLITNEWFNIVAKAIITILCGWLIYLMVDVRDFIKYKQPATDLQQNTSITFVSDRLNECNAQQNEKNTNVNQRIDQQSDKVNNIERKIDFIIYKFTGDEPTAYNQN